MLCSQHSLPDVTTTVRRISPAIHLDFLQHQQSVSFLQTPAWGRVKREWRAESLGWFDGGRLIGAALVLHRPIPAVERFTLAYLAEGPILDWTEQLQTWLDPLTEYLKQHGAFAIRLGPPVRTHTWTAGQVKDGIADPAISRLTDIPVNADPLGASVTKQLREAGWLPQNPEDGFGTGHPQFTFELLLRGPDGTPRSEEDLLAGMNQLWRRNIKKAAKAGVQVTTTLALDDLWTEDVKAFHQLYLHTAERDHFTPRPLSYFETMFTAMKHEDPNRIRLYQAHHEGDLVAAAIMIGVRDTAWYSYGASSTHKREVRGSNAVQWAMIRDALADRCNVYSLRGITPTLDPEDPHLGLIQFKVGTGGQATRYVGEWELPVRPMLYRAFVAYLKGRDRWRRRSR